MAKLLAISSFWKAAGMTRFSTLFQKPKPVIAMVHLGALPGSPLYDAAAGLERLLSAARADLLALLFLELGDKLLNAKTPAFSLTKSSWIGAAELLDGPSGID